MQTQAVRAKRHSVVDRSSSRRAATLLACLAGIVIAPAASARPAPQGSPAFRQLESFGGPPIGTNPAAGLLQATDGALYGTAFKSGRYGFGTLFKLNPDGTGFTVLLHFDGSTTGGGPAGMLIQGTDGALYGTTSVGGSSDYGTVFKLNPDGTGFTVLEDLDGATTGANPYAGLIQGTDGALYGTASAGGSSDFGTVFKLNPDGTGFTVLREFNGSKAANPYAALMQGTDGALYGTAFWGGPGGPGNPGSIGALFKLNTDGTGYKILHAFDFTTGAHPVSELIQGTDGALYGTAAYGGSRDEGTFFKLNPDGSGFTVLLNFDHSTTGTYPLAIMQGTDGAIYGAMLVGSWFTKGVVFKLNPDGTGFTFLVSSDATNELIQGTDGALYGTSSSSFNPGDGTVFKLNTDGSAFTVLRAFSSAPDLTQTGGDPFAGLIEGTDGALYGTTNSGGTNQSFSYGQGDGAVFKIDPDGTGFTVLLNLDVPTTGGNPYAGLMLGKDGALYGTTWYGGSNGSGTVFKLNPDGTGFAVLRSFGDASTGDYLYSGLIQGTDGALYGTTYFGGSGGCGTVFKLEPDGTGFSVLASLDGATTGSNPGGTLMQGTDGALYGTASSGGSGGYGTVFRLNPDGTGFSVLQDFDNSTTGGNVLAGLTQGTDGALYGTAATGGSDDWGTVFKLNPDGTGFSVLHNFNDSTTGGDPIAGLMLGKDGGLYGTSCLGGSNGDGTLFKLNADGSGFTVLLNFEHSTSGANPRGGMIQGTDGNLYGTTSAGGEVDVGTVFRMGIDCTASWTNYGAGFAGTNGVPGFASSANPVLGTTITLTVANSSVSATAAFLVAGLNRASTSFKLGTLLVDPFRDWLLVLPLSLSATGVSFDSAVPSDESLCCFHMDLQVLEIDAGAAQGVSFTPGLELVLGH